MNLVSYFDRYAQTRGFVSIGERQLKREERVGRGLQRFAVEVLGHIFTRRIYTSEQLYQRLERIGFVKDEKEYEEFLQLAVKNPPRWHSNFFHILVFEEDKKGRGLIRITDKIIRDSN